MPEQVAPSNGIEDHELVEAQLALGFIAQTVEELGVVDLSVEHDRH